MSKVQETKETEKIDKGLVLKETKKSNKTKKTVKVKTVKAQSKKQKSKARKKAKMLNRAKDKKAVKTKAKKTVKTKTVKSIPQVDPRIKANKGNYLFSSKQSPSVRIALTLLRMIPSKFVTLNDICILINNKLKIKIDIGQLATKTKLGVYIRNGLYSGYASALHTGVDKRKDGSEYSQFAHDTKLHIVPVGKISFSTNTGYKKLTKYMSTAPSKAEVDTLKEAIRARI